MSRITRKRAISALLSAIGVAGATSALGGERTFDFTQDPAGIGIEVKGNNDQPWQEGGGNPGGFLALTYPQGGQFAAMEFPDIDAGKIVTAFRFEADLRVGNSTGDRAADGFSVSFARLTDPLIEGDLGNQGAFAGGIAEGGTTTGIAICFDTWSGNTLPDSADIEGILVRVDNKTVNRTALPTRHGACDDATSLQTGPRAAQYWADGGDPRDPGSWATLCWQKAIVDVTPDAKVTVSWKGRKILDNFQTSYFPSAGKLILAGRTGGANEHTHFDNIKLVTTATEADTVKPTDPVSPKVDAAGARRVVLSWGASTDNSGRVAYRVEREGVRVGGVLTDTTYEDRNVSPGKTYSYNVYAQDVSGNESAKIAVSATTVAEVPGPAFLLAEIYDAIGGTPVDNLLTDAKYPASPDRGRYVNGLSFGEPGFGDTFGDNFGVRIAGVLTAPESGAYYFHVRSDDASRFYINTASAAIPDANADSPVAEETGCCTAFLSSPDEQVSEPITLTAGRQYGVLYLVKEGGGGDWGQVGWSRTGVASDVSVIQGAILQGVGDPVGAVVEITQAPANLSVAAYKSAMFSVQATTASPYTTAVAYQWYKNGAIIPGAIGKSYTVAVAQPADNGAKYKVLVAVPGKSATSAEATLTVTANVPAMVDHVEGSDTFTTATVTFDQPVAAASAGTAANYTISGGITVSAAVVVNPTTVRLTTSRQAVNTSYTVTVANVQNLGNTPVAAGTTKSFKSWVLAPGKAKYEQYNGIGGVAIQALLDDPDYPNSPNVSRIVDGYEGPTNTADNYGAVLSGWITPTETADYVFFVSADDNAELYLSTDETTANAKLIAREPEWNGVRQWAIADRRPNLENRSDSFAETAWPSGATINLTAGKSYYTYLIYKEGGGGDNGAVAWIKKGAADPAVGSAPITAHISTFAPPPTAVGPVAIAVTGGNVRITFEGMLQSSPAVTGPYTDVAGATGGSYTTPPSAAAAFYRARSN